MGDSPFNDAGEPYMTAADWSYEQSLDAESQYDWDDEFDYYDDEDFMP